MVFYARPYIKLDDGSIINGKIISFATNNIEYLRLANLDITSAELLYTYTGTPEPSEHGICYGLTPGPDISGTSIQGMADGTICRANIENLSAATEYFAVPYMKINGTVWYGEEFTFRTFADYSTYRNNFV